MKERNLIFIIVACATLIVACATVPFTGRKQMKWMPGNTINQMALAGYTDFLKENKVSANQNNVNLVREIGRNVQRATERYYKSIGQENRLADFDWQFNLVEDKLVNAWCMPGGRVVVYTGILDVAKNSDGLAVVMGHEIAHALAHHGNERMSQGLAAQLGGVAVAVAVKDKPAETQSLFMTAYGVGTQLGAMLPFSRKHESEADEIGLYIMAMAGYDANEAAPFWGRMNAMAGQSPPEFLSTHPAPERRSATLKSLVPKAQEYINKYGSAQRLPRKYFTK